MIYNKIFAILFLCVLTACSGGSRTTPPPNVTVNPPHNSPNVAAHLAATGNNVMSVSVSGSTCTSHKYTNEPCVSVTICTPGTSTCQTINNILLDTGSYGLRIFSSVVTLSLPSVNDASSNPYATCASFGTGADWGPVKTADVVLGDSGGGEKAPNVSIQLIDDTFANSKNNCANGAVDHSPAEAYYNGILGIGLFSQDCGANCANSATNGLYFSCVGTTCTSARIPLAKQISNPIYSMPTDNNGAILSLPDVSSLGASDVTGNLILGIGTSSNNQPDSGLYFLQASSNTAYITNTYKTRTTRSLLDSGTNAYGFYDNTIPNCSSSTNYYCPPSTTALTAVQTGTDGSNYQVTFNLDNAISVFSNNNYVYNNVGFAVTSAQNFFIYGLPFHLGKSVFIGLEGRSSSLGSGFYWAY